jgi:AcrR family transcriptional regulator
MSNDRDEWIALGVRMLDQGRVPAEIGYVRAGAEIGVGKGSFVHHFPDGAAEWHTGIIELYKNLRRDILAEQAIEMTGDPEEKLLRLRVIAERYAARDAAMGRWGASVMDDKPKSCADLAQEAVMEIGKEIIAHAQAAFLDMGLSPLEAEAEALLIAPELGCPRVPVGDAAKFRALLDVRLAAGKAGQPTAAELVEVTGDDGEILACIVPIRPGADMSDIEAALRQLDRRIHPGTRTGSNGTAVVGGTSRRS